MRNELKIWEKGTELRLNRGGVINEINRIAPLDEYSHTS